MCDQNSNASRLTKHTYVYKAYIDIKKAATIRSIWTDCEWNVRNENNLIYVN